MELDSFIGEENANRLAFESGFAKRNGGKIKSFAFLCGLCAKAIEGGCSLGKHAVTLSLILSNSVSKQGVLKRINSRSGAFLIAILQLLVGKRMRAGKVVGKELLALFPRIIIQDSTVVALHKSLFEYFPGSKNQNGVSSSLKIQAVYDLISGAFVLFDMTSFRVNDQAAALSLGFLKKGDLLIRDLGYFTVKAFKEIAKRQAYFLSRLKYGVGLLDIDDESKVNLLELLRGKQEIDFDALLGASQKVPVRVVGRRLPDDVANKRRRDYRASRDKKLNPSKEHLALLGWNLFVTNVPRELWSVETIELVYSLRWRIEIIFKSWKSCLNFNLRHKCSPAQVIALVYARLIIITIFSSYYFIRFESKILNNHGKCLSLIKFIDMFMSDTDKMLEYVNSNNTRVQKLLIDILLRNATYEKRRRTNYTLVLSSLSGRVQTTLSNLRSSSVKCLAMRG